MAPTVPWPPGTWPPRPPAQPCPCPFYPTFTRVLWRVLRGSGAWAHDEGGSEPMANPVGWFEVLGPDGGALQRFYADAFGWQVDADNEMNYGMVAAEEGSIGGGVAGSPD